MRLRARHPLLGRGIISPALSSHPRTTWHNIFYLVAEAARFRFWRYLIRSFAYIVLVFVDTPISDNALARSLGRLAESSDMRDRFTRAKRFLEHLEAEEEGELLSSGKRSGPYRRAIATDLHREVRQEIRGVGRKLRLPDPY